MDEDSDTEIAEENLNNSFKNTQISQKSPQREKFKPPSRGGHTSNYFPHLQQIICFGGSNDKSNNNELYCLSTSSGKWIDCSQNQIGDIPSPRYAHTCVMFMNQMILFGGLDGKNYFSDMYVMNPRLEEKSFRWKRIIPSSTKNPEGRYGHTLNDLGDKLVLFGGFGAQKRAYNDLWVFDVFNNNWSMPTIEGNPPEPRFYHSTSVVNKNLVIYGGKNSNIYFNDIHILNTRNPIFFFPLSINFFFLEMKRWIKVELKNNFQIGRSIPNRAYHSANVIMGDYIFILGGYDGKDLFSDIQVFDMKEMCWFEFGNINSKRCKHTANAISNEMILVFGGHDGSK